MKPCGRCKVRASRTGQRWCRACATEYERLRRLDPAIRERTLCQWRESWAKQPEQRKAAKTAVYLARYHGKLIPDGRCMDCGREVARIQGHHADYTRPLEVEWLCAGCHGERHARLGVGRGNRAGSA
jgi:hypothetical protein